MYLDISNKLLTNEIFGLYNIRQYKEKDQFMNIASATSNGSGIGNGIGNPIELNGKKKCNKPVKLFNSNNELRFDIDGMALFNDKGVRTHNIDPITKKRTFVKEKFNNVEHFLFNIGSSTSTTNNLNIKKTYENNQNINRSMQTEALTKLFNNTANEVIQNNMATASAAAGALNSMSFQGIRCDNIKIRGVDQSNDAMAKLVSSQKQKAQNDITTDIITNINKKITQPPATDMDDIVALQTANRRAMNDFMNSNAGYDPSKAPSAAGSCFDIGSSNSVTNNTSIDANVKSSLNLDESFKVTDNDDLHNEVSNKISQSNIATCQGNAAAANQINFGDIACGNLDIGDIKQSNVVSLLVTCMFDQEAINKIVTKIQTKISKQIGQIYDAVTTNIEKKFCEGQEKEAMIEYFRLGGGLDAIAGVQNETMAQAAGITLTPAEDVKAKKQDVVKFTEPDNKPPPPSVLPKPSAVSAPTTTSTSTPASPTSATTPKQETSLLDTIMNLPPIAIGGIILLLIIIIVSAMR